MPAPAPAPFSFKKYAKPWLPKGYPTAVMTILRIHLYNGDNDNDNDNNSNSNNSHNNNHPPAPPQAMPRLRAPRSGP